MLQHPSPETIAISNQKWSWAEGPASKGQDQCSNIQVQKQASISKQYQFTSGQLLWRNGVQKQCYRKTVPSIVEGFENDVSNVLSPKSKNIIICYWKWSWAAGPASKGQVQCFLIKNEAGPWFQLQNDCPTAFLRQDGGRQVGRAGRGVPGLPGTRARSGRGRPGWAWRARLGAIIQIGQIIGFLDRLLKILPGSKLLVKLGSREEDLKLFDFLENVPYCPIIFGS